jgi:hypothetical protein
MAKAMTRSPASASSSPNGAQQRFLPRGVEADDQVVPGLAQEVAGVERRRQELRGEAFLLFELAVVERVEDVLRRHRRGRIDAAPALALDPHLGPGVRVLAVDHPVVADVVAVAAGVAGDHARGMPALRMNSA